MRVWIDASVTVAMTLLLTATVLAATAPVPPPKPYAAFLVDPTSGALVPIEHVRDKIEERGYQGREKYPYLVGAQSSVTLPAGVPLHFVLRIDGRDKDLQRWRGTSCHYLERFLSEKDRRYRTGQGFRLEQETSDIVRGLDPEKPKKGSHIVSLKSPGLTTPGEYGVVQMGCPGEKWDWPSHQFGAFRVATAAAAPAASRPPASAASAPPATAPDLRALREAAERGDKAAQYQLGYAYGRGTGVPQDYELAALWLRKAAAQGLGDAQHLLAVMHRDGLGMPKDDVQAAQLFRQAAEQGQPVAQIYLAEYFADGKGVFKDMVEAHKWLNLAAARLTGDDQKQAAGFRDQIAAQLTPAQLVEAQKRAREWMAAFEKRSP